MRDSNLEYAAAYGSAQIEPRRAATPAMRYAVGSISKEFTATALLLLQEAGKLSIDDAAGRWVPEMCIRDSRRAGPCLPERYGMRSRQRPRWSE